SVAEQYLFQAANAERVQRGLRPLRWDGALSHAAALHAREMADRESISHQYPGEQDLADRAQSAGAQFSVVAENVAEAPNAVTIHTAWMHSPDHRANLLDDRVDRIGIGVLVRDGEVYAVEDFDRGVAALSFEEQENAIATLLSPSSNLQVQVQVQVADEAARRTCAMNSGFAGDRRPWFVMRFTTGELDVLPDQLKARLASGKFHTASIGACAARGTGPFTSYNIAVLLFP
ncbi:MAG: CAP domain-containing protein, partial [Janthinobacterium lividum]